MIEAIVKYIEDRGFIVIVRSRYIVIRKEWQGEFCSFVWSISQHDLNQRQSSLFWYADKLMWQIDEAIRQRESEVTNKKR